MMQHNRAILEAAGAYLGLQEWPGARQNPQIVQMFEDVGHRQVQDDETPWCAAFVGSVLASLGLPHTGKLNARSYITYGQAVKTQEARPGDIVVLWRGSRDSWQGHVGFFVGFDGNRVILRGGNQRNGAVTDSEYDIDRILAVRRADGVEARGKRPVIRRGDRGIFVGDLQTRLTNLGYTLGKIDMVMGARSVAALVSFQIDNGLVADGIAGDRTWEALDRAEPRPLRQITEADLKESRTLREADAGKNVVAVSAAVGGLSTAVAAGEQAYETLERAGTLLEAAWSSAPWLVAAAVIIGASWFAWKHFHRVREIRIEDARTGANDRR